MGKISRCPFNKNDVFRPEDWSRYTRQGRQGRRQDRQRAQGGPHLEHHQCHCKPRHLGQPQVPTMSSVRNAWDDWVRTYNLMEEEKNNYSGQQLQDQRRQQQPQQQQNIPHRHQEEQHKQPKQQAETLRAEEEVCLSTPPPTYQQLYGRPEAKTLNELPFS